MELLHLYPEILPACRMWYKEAAIFSNPSLGSFDDSLNRPDSMFRLIHEPEPDLGVVGLVGIERINWIDRTCEGMVVIAENHREKTFATHGVQLMLDLVQKELGLRKVTALVLEGSASEGLVSKLGFEVEGVLQKHVFNRGEHKNVVIMSKFLGEK